MVLNLTWFDDISPLIFHSLPNQESSMIFIFWLLSSLQKLPLPIIATFFFTIVKLHYFADFWIPSKLPISPIALHSLLANNRHSTSTKFNELRVNFTQLVEKTNNQSSLHFAHHASSGYLFHWLCMCLFSAHSTKKHFTRLPLHRGHIYHRFPTWENDYT